MNINIFSFYTYNLCNEIDFCLNHPSNERNHIYSNTESILCSKQNKILDLKIIKPKQAKDHTTLNQFSHENKSKSR